MSPAELGAIVKGIVPVLRHHVDGAAAPMLKEIGELKSELAAMKADAVSVDSFAHQLAKRFLEAANA